MRTPALVIATTATLLVAGVSASYALAISAPPIEAPEEHHPRPVTAVPDASDPVNTPVTPAPSAPTSAPPTAAPEPTDPQPAPTPPQTLRRGDEGAAVEVLQRRLVELGLDPGPVDGHFGLATVYVVYTVQALHGLTKNGVVGPQVRDLLEHPLPIPALVPDGPPTRVEVDLARQLLIVRREGQVVLVTHVSTGSGDGYCVDGECMTADTPVGTYAFTWRVDGWRTSRLGQLYNPVYFNGGIAVHGSTDGVPSYPASHGCVRIPMHIAEYFPDLVDEGDPISIV